MLNKDEFKLLFDTHFDGLRSFIFYRCGNTDMATDIAQDVFMKIWEKRGQLDNGNLKALLYKMASEMSISNYRKKICRDSFEQSMSYFDNAGLSPEDEMLSREFVSLYSNALERMPESQRTVFLMSRNDEMKYQEIAELLNISVKAVEKRMSAALQLLRKELLLT